MYHYNNNKFLQTLTTPGRIPGHVAFFAGMAAMLALFSIDMWTNRDVQLHILYVFPIALIVLHHKSAMLINFSIVFAIMLMSITLAYDRFTLTTAVANETIGVLAYCAMIFFAYTARMNYLKAVDSATVDPLTQLLNRRGFDPILDLEVARWKRYGVVFSLALLDLDRFKELNDKKGHRTGDLALKLFAEILVRHIRESDTVARIGGDEFALIMPHAHHAEGALICEKLCREVEHQMAERGYGVTVSIGCKTFDTVSETMNDALNEADRLMYEAKNAGKNRVVSA